MSSVWDAFTLPRGSRVTVETPEGLLDCVLAGDALSKHGEGEIRVREIKTGRVHILGFTEEGKNRTPYHWEIVALEPMG